MSTSTATRQRRARFPGAKTRAPKKTSYHHGDLREALIHAALALVEERGPDGFTMREAARKVGVTHTAPYRHFADKDALLVAVAEDGFEGLHATTLARLEGARDPRERLQQIGIAYVEYAVAHPSHFRVMHGTVADSCAEPAFEGVKGKTFLLLLDILRECQAAGLIPAGPVERYALTAWSTVHGLAELLMSGAVFHMGLADGSVRDVTRQVTNDLMDGLSGAGGLVGEAGARLTPRGSRTVSPSRTPHAVRRRP